MDKDAISNPIPYGRQSISEEDVWEVTNVLQFSWLTQGPKVQEFEKVIASYCGAKYAVVVSSGTAALHLACAVAGLTSGKEAVTSPLSFLATSNAILYCGAKPIFADINPESGNLSPEEVQKKLTVRTRVLLPVHFAGLPCDLLRFRSIARKAKLVIIEDACHALGAEYRGSKVGSCRYSDMSVFSFHPVKHVTTGEGGAITTNNRNFYRKLLLLRNHGMLRSPALSKRLGGWVYQMTALGFNYRITDIQCALGISQMRKLDAFLEKRKEIARKYTDALSEYKDLLILPDTSDADRTHAWHLFALRLKEPFAPKRRLIYDRLHQEGIRVQIHYIPIHLQPFYRRLLGTRPGNFPFAESFYTSELSLPIFPGLTSAMQGRVLSALTRELNLFRGRRRTPFTHETVDIAG